MEFKAKQFEMPLWLSFIVIGILLDGFIPFYNILFIPYSCPSVGDIVHLVYNMAIAITFYIMLERMAAPVPKYVRLFFVLLLAIGASIHLVPDSIQNRYILTLGYDLSIPMDENPLFKSLNPGLLNLFHVLYFYDESFSHYLWFGSILTGLVMIFFCSFSHSLIHPPFFSSEAYLKSLLVLFGGIYLVNVALEAQMIVLFGVYLLVCLGIYSYRHSQGLSLDQNGQFIAWTNLFILLILIVWRVVFQGFLEPTTLLAPYLLN